MTRVTAGAIPDSRARRRAICPTSSFFFFLFFISGALSSNFAHRAPGLIDRLVRIRKGSGIGIRNMNAPKRLAPDLTRRLPRRPFRIVQRVVFIRISVRPTIDRDSLNVARRVKSSRTQGPAQLLPNVPLKSLKGRCEQ